MGVFTCFIGHDYTPFCRNRNFGLAKMLWVLWSFSCDSRPVSHIATHPPYAPYPSSVAHFQQFYHHVLLLLFLVIIFYNVLSSVSAFYVCMGTGPPIAALDTYTWLCTKKKNGSPSHQQLSTVSSSSIRHWSWRTCTPHAGVWAGLLLLR